MKAFPGWRAVGATLRWARQQEGVQHARTTMAGTVREDGTTPLYVDHKFTAEGGFPTLLVSFSSVGYGVDICLGDGEGSELECTGWTAVQLLRMLAALDLIPAELAVADV